MLKGGKQTANVTLTLSFGWAAADGSEQGRAWGVWLPTPCCEPEGKPGRAAGESAGERCAHAPARTEAESGTRVAASRRTLSACRQGLHTRVHRGGREGEGTGTSPGRLTGTAGPQGTVTADAVQDECGVKHKGTSRGRGLGAAGRATGGRGKRLPDWADGGDRGPHRGNNEPRRRKSRPQTNRTTATERALNERLQPHRGGASPAAC